MQCFVTCLASLRVQGLQGKGLGEGVPERIGMGDVWLWCLKPFAKTRMGIWGASGSLECGNLGSGLACARRAADVASEHESFVCVLRRRGPLPELAAGANL